MYTITGADATDPVSLAWCARSQARVQQALLLLARRASGRTQVQHDVRRALSPGSTRSWQVTNNVSTKKSTSKQRDSSASSSLERFPQWREMQPRFCLTSRTRSRSAPVKKACGRRTPGDDGRHDARRQLPANFQHQQGVQEAGITAPTVCAAVNITIAPAERLSSSKAAPQKTWTQPGVRTDLLQPASNVMGGRRRASPRTSSLKQTSSTQ